MNDPAQVGNILQALIFILVGIGGLNGITVAFLIKNEKRFTRLETQMEILVDKRKTDHA